MSAGWQSKLARISAMDGREVRVRASQEIHKRRDLLLHKLGIRQDVSHSALKSPTKGGEFFFSADEVATRVQLLEQNLPDHAAEILREANDICAHKFRLLGYEGLTFDRPSVTGETAEIDWHLDPVHDKRAPLVPWFKIPFLDFAVVGDHKVTWELNRHQHLATLAKASLLSDNPAYREELIRQWHSWIKANPYPLGINWGSSLEVAFRSLSWIWIDQLLAPVKPASANNENSEFQTDQFRAELRASLAFHGRYIEKYLSIYFSPNTHLLGEAVALFFLGTLFPEMPHAARWKSTGWEIVVDAARRQVRPDGVYFEQSLYYHVYALDFFLYARLLADRNGVPIPPAFDATLQKMLDVIEAQAQAGVAEGFGDDDGGRIFNPRRNRTEHLTDPLALGALIYGRNSPAAQLTEESIWLFGEMAVDRLAAKHTDFTVRSQAFPDGGVYVLADGRPFPQVMTVDAGPQGVGRSGHGHADALSVRLTMNGRRWLVDSGSGVYIAQDRADRDTFRGTGSHNTLRVDGQDQAVADEPFSWTHIPTAKAETWVAGESFTYFVGSHNGYERLSDPVTHRRHVLQIAGNLWLVRDVAVGNEEHQIEIRWHFAPDLDVKSTGDAQIEISPRSSSNGTAPTALSLIVPTKTSWQTTVEKTRSVVSPAYGLLQPAPLVTSAARIKLPTEIATVLMPRTIANHGKHPSPDHSNLALTSIRQATVQVYKLTDRYATHEFFFANSNDNWSFGAWTSDAQLVYCRSENAKISHLIVVGGTQVTWQGQALMRAEQTSDFFEWQAHESVMHLGGFCLTDLFEELTGSTSSSSGSVRDLSSFVEKH